jgi:hypothetical protein
LLSNVGCFFNTFTSFSPWHLKNTQFQQLGVELELVAAHTMEQTLTVLHSFSLSITTAAVTTTSSSTSTTTTDTAFPTVTVPYYHIPTQSLLELIHADWIVWTPLVNTEQLSDWETYAERNQHWIQDGLDYSYRRQQEQQQQQPNNNPTTATATTTTNPPLLPFPIAEPIPATIYSNEGNTISATATTLMDGTKYFLPLWQMAPTTSDTAGLVNLDLLSSTIITNTNTTMATISMPDMVRRVTETRRGVLSAMGDCSYLSPSSSSSSSSSTTNNNDNNQSSSFSANKFLSPPSSFILQPILASLDPSKEETTDVVGFVLTVFSWDRYLTNMIRSSGGDFFGTSIVMKDGCGDTVHTYGMFDNDQVQYLGPMDSHETDYDELGYSIAFATMARYNNNHSNKDVDSASSPSCGDYTWHVYPTSALETSYRTKNNIFFAWGIVGLFTFILLLLGVYIRLVKYRQRKLLNAARKTNAIVASLFPQKIQERMMEEVEVEPEGHDQGGGASTFGQFNNNNNTDTDNSNPPTYNQRFGSLVSRSTMDVISSFDITKRTSSISQKALPSLRNSFMPQPSIGNNITGTRRSGGGAGDRFRYAFDTKPIADFFPDVTIFFADLTGFTAWSSTREPTQVRSFTTSYFDCCCVRLLSLKFRFYIQELLI